MDQFGNYIRIARKAKGLTLQQLESLTGIRYQLLYRYEKGIQVPNAKTRSKIENALNINFSELNKEDEEINRLFDSFYMLLFMGERNFKNLEESLKNNDKRYQSSRYYYLIQLIIYIIYVLNQEDLLASRMENKLVKMVNHDPKTSSLYWHYKGVKYYRKNKFRDAEECYNKAASVCQDERYLALNYYQKFFIFKKRNQLIEAKELIEKARMIFSNYL